MKDKDKNLLLIFQCALTAVIFAAAFLIWRSPTVNFADVISAATEHMLILIFVICCVYFIKGVIMIIPVSGLYLLVGALFGHVGAALAVNCLGVFVSLTAGYINGFLLKGKKTLSLKERYPALETLENFGSDNAFFFSYVARLAGFVPCDLVSLYCGIKALPYQYYILGSVAGMLPGIVLTTIMGANISNPASPRFVISAAIHVMLWVFSALYYKKIKEKNEAERKEI